MITDIVVGLVFLLLVLLGVFRGFIKSVVMLIKIPVTIVVSFIAASPLSGLLKNVGLQETIVGWTGWPIQTAGVIVLLTLAVIIFVIIRLILWKLVKKSDKAKEKRKVLGKVDRLLGLVFGTVHFMIIFTLVSIVFFFLTLIPFFSHWHEIVFEGSYVTVHLYDFLVRFVVEQAYAALPGAPPLVT